MGKCCPGEGQHLTRDGEGMQTGSCTKCRMHSRISALKTQTSEGKANSSPALDTLQHHPRQERLIKAPGLPRCSLTLPAPSAHTGPAGRPWAPRADGSDCGDKPATIPSPIYPTRKIHLLSAPAPALADLAWHFVPPCCCPFSSSWCDSDSTAPSLSASLYL